MSEYKYDVAISFAEEDKEIAWAITRSLQAKGLEVFYYKDEHATTWGDHLYDITLNRYKSKAKLALVLISENYVQKEWTMKEWEIIQVAQRERSEKIYLLPLRLDDTSVKGFNEHFLYKMWENNADEVASVIKQRLKKMKQLKKETQKKKKKKLEKAIKQQKKLERSESNGQNSSIKGDSNTVTQTKKKTPKGKQDSKIIGDSNDVKQLT